jgi:TonB family protein
MKLLISSLFFLISLSSFSQKVKEKTEIDYDNGYRDEYSVLKKDKTLKHGPFKSTYVNGSPREEGFYKYGQKDSLWTHFHFFNGILKSRGVYNNGERVGLWEYFDKNGKLLQEYNHSTKVLSYNKVTDTTVRYTIQIEDSIIHDVRLQRSPFYLGGNYLRTRVIQDEIYYPQEAIDLNIYGTVWISFYVTPEGKTEDYAITTRIGGGCDEEALRVVKLIPDNWAPAIYENQLVKVQIQMPITFVLN